MIKRRHFLKASALSALGSSFIVIPSALKAGSSDPSPVVKQPEQCETFFVRENTPITFHLSKVSDNIQNVSVCTEVIQQGGSIPTHKHVYSDEYFYFISGTGTITANDVETPFKPGTSAFVPGNTWHSLKNTGVENVFLVFGYSPSGFEDFFRQIGTPKEQPFKQKPKEEFDAICQKFGMVFK